MPDITTESLNFDRVNTEVTGLNIPGFTPSQEMSGPQQLTWLRATTTWFRQSEASGTAVLWIATTDDRTVYRSVDQSWLSAWQSVIMNAQVLWLQVDADNIIRAWQPGKAF